MHMHVWVLYVLDSVKLHEFIWALWHFLVTHRLFSDTLLREQSRNLQSKPFWLRFYMY